MMRYLYLLFISLFLLTNCTHQLKDGDPPDNLLNQDEFYAVLYDVLVVESFYNTHPDRNKIKPSITKSMDSIFRKHKIDSARFHSSMDYYSTHQEALVEIYNKIQDSLTMKTAKYSED